MIPPRWSLVALACIPLIANWPLVTGWLMGDPVYTLSRLGMFHVPGPLAGVTSIDPSVGLMTEALGRAAAFAWLHGHIPWWNAFNGAGLPLAAEGQNQALFLPFVLLFALRNGPLLVLLAVQEVAAFSAYALLRRLALRRAAAWIGAALFALNGTFAWFGHSPIMPIAFTPLLLLGIEMEWNAIVQRRPSRGWVVVAIALAFSLYAGFPETAYLDALLCAAWTLLRIAQSSGTGRVRFTLRVGAGALAGLLLGAPYIVPFLHLLSVGQVNLPRMLDFSNVAIPPAALPTLFMPYVLGPQSLVLDWNRIEASLWSYLGGYLTLSIVFLAIVGAVVSRAPGRALRWLLAGWCVVMVGASYGVPGLAQFVYAVPALRETMVFRYSPPSWELAAVILVAMAVDDWQSGRLHQRGVAAAFVAALAAGVAALSAARHSVAYLWANVEHYAPWLLASAGGALVVALAIALVVAARPSARRTALLAVLLVGESVALFSVPRLAGLRHAELDTDAIDYLKQHLGLQRAFAFGTLLPNFSAYFQVAAINSNYVPAPRLWTEYIRTALDPGSQTEFFDGITVFGQAPRTDMAAFRANLPAYAELGVRYVLVPAHATLIQGGDPATAASLIPGLLPQPVFVGRLMSIYELQTPAAYFETSPACRIRSDTRTSVTADCNAPSRLIRRELFYDGWRATVNGQPAPIAHADPIFQSVELPAGSARVEFHYAPPFARAIAAAFIAGLAMIAAGIVGRRRRRDAIAEP